uniref:Uncharacterized protein n=1 Tax=Clytia hemisphaerica TaxID=252671 RepID=A0A7M5XMX6_9CNID
IIISSRRYFNHQKREKKKKELMSPAELEADVIINRMSSRRSKTFQRRRKIGLQMNSAGEELELFNLINGGELMTDEEAECDEEGRETGRLIVRKLTWRSLKLDDLITKIDMEKPPKNVKGRIFGEPSEREPPSGIDERCVDILPPQNEQTD